MRLFSELKRRNVIRVATAYVVASWLIIQVAETILPAYGFGDAALRLVIALLAVAFIPTLVFSWVFEFTPQGLKREVEVEQEESITRFTGKRIDRVIMVLLALAVGFFLFDRLVLIPARETVIAASGFRCRVGNGPAIPLLAQWSRRFGNPDRVLQPVHKWSPAGLRDDPA